MAVGSARSSLRATGIIRTGESHMKHVVTALIGTLALYAVAANAFASEASDALPQEIVRFGDLDLTRPAGAQELYSRITRAARDVCQIDTFGGSFVVVANRLCTDRAIARAVEEIDAPLLTERHQQKSHQDILKVQQVGLNR